MVKKRLFAGLKKVTKDMQTHKNPELRGTSVVPAGDAKAVAAPKTAAAPVAKKDKPPRKVLEFDRKWIIVSEVILILLTRGALLTSRGK